MPLCGPKLSMCCSVLSAWGMVQLGLTGLFFYLGSPALIEDIPLLENEAWTGREWQTHIQAGYQQSALNCWTAALLYLVTLSVSAHQVWANTQNQQQFKAAQF